MKKVAGVELKVTTETEKRTVIHIGNLEAAITKEEIVEAISKCIEADSGISK